MTDKRFKIYGDVVEDTYGIIPLTVWSIEKQKQKYCDELNKLNNENEQLKTDNNAYLQDIEVYKEKNTELQLRNDRQAVELL